MLTVPLLFESETSLLQSVQVYFSVCIIPFLSLQLRFNFLKALSGSTLWMLILLIAIEDNPQRRKLIANFATC
jgi:hypothetical protein